MSGYYNLNINQGESYALTIIAKDSDGVPQNLSGYTGFAGIKSNYCSTGYLANFDVSISLPTSGQVSMSMTAADTANLPATIALYDLEIASGSIVTKLLKGNVFIYPEISSSFP